jgi:hypothetical protein
MLPYRRRVRMGKAEAAVVKEAKLRQLSLLERRPETRIPQEIEAKALDLLVQLLIAVMPAIEGGRDDEQDQK